MSVTLSRREFTKLMAAATVAPPFSQQARSGRTIGIQVGAVSFLDEGVDPVLDRFQRDANVNALFIATFTYGRGIAGRQVPVFFFQAEDGIRDLTVTGVQTCALPI